MSFIFAFFVIMAYLTIGDFVSTKTKAMVPSVFIAASLFVISFWTGLLPRNVMDVAAIGGMTPTLFMYLLIVHMGTMLSIKELCAEWRTVVVSICALVGMSLVLVFVGTKFLEWNAIVIGVPPLAGGLVAAIIMGEAAKDMGYLALLAPAIFVVQGFVGYPLTAVCLRIEGTNLLKKFRAGELTAKAAGAAEQSRRIIPPLPEKYQTTFYHLAAVAFVGWLAYLTNLAEVAALNAINPSWVKFALHPLVICLIYGAIAAEVGFLERKAMTRAESVGFGLAVIMALMMCMLNQSTPQDMILLIYPLFVIVTVGVIGLIITAAVVGKVLGYSAAMSVGLALTSLYGFPPNYILTEEAAKGLAETPEEQAFLMDRMLPKMLIGGFMTVTIGSVILAGIFASMIVAP